MVTDTGKRGYRRSRHTLAWSNLAVRAARIKVLLTDNDGVLTDTGVYYSSEGEQLKRYSIRDGMAVELLRSQGIETGIISGETSDNLRRRAEKLRIRHLYLGVYDKRGLLKTILNENRLETEHIAYIGDDVNDADIIRAVRDRGLTGSPSDAVAAIRASVHFIAPSGGGYGAFRDFAEWILRYRPQDHRTTLAQYQPSPYSAETPLWQTGTFESETGSWEKDSRFS